MASADTDERRVTAWIGKGVVVEGRITSGQDLRIDGKVDGTVEVPNHNLTVGQGAEIKANLVARSILIGGTVVGHVTADELVGLTETGSLEGDISAPRLVMAEGAFFRGSVAAASEPAKKSRTS